MRTNASCLTVGFFVLFCTVFSAAMGKDESTEKPAPGKPRIKVLSPGGAGVVMGSWGAAKIVICLEITDISGAGITMDDFGMPRFVESNKNVDLFVSHIVAKGTYVDGSGHAVIQLVSVLPTENLKTGSFRLTPPIDLSSVPERFRKNGFVIPSEAMLDAVDFNFQVKDRMGETSELSRLSVAFAPDLFRGPFSSPPTEQGAEPSNHQQQQDKLPIDAPH